MAKRKHRDNEPKQLDLFDRSPYWQEVKAEQRRKPFYYLRRHVGSRHEEEFLVAIDEDGRGHWMTADFRVAAPVIWNNIRRAQDAVHTYGGRVEVCYKNPRGGWWTR